jgi:Phage tail protein.
MFNRVPFGQTKFNVLSGQKSIVATSRAVAGGSSRLVSRKFFIIQSLAKTSGHIEIRSQKLFSGTSLAKAGGRSDLKAKKYFNLMSLAIASGKMNQVIPNNFYGRADAISSGFMVFLRRAVIDGRSLGKASGRVDLFIRRPLTMRSLANSSGYMTLTSKKFFVFNVSVASATGLMRFFQRIHISMVAFAQPTGYMYLRQRVNVGSAVSLAIASSNVRLSVVKYLRSVSRAKATHDVRSRITSRKFFVLESFARSHGILQSLNQFTFEAVELSGLSLKPGQVLIIDTGAMTITLDGENAMHYFDSQTSDFFDLSPGENIVILQDGNLNRNATVDIKWRNKWV